MPARTMIRTLDTAVIGLVVLAIAILGLFAWAARVADRHAFATESTIVGRELQREVDLFRAALPRSLDERPRWLGEAPNVRVILPADPASPAAADAETMIGSLVSAPGTSERFTHLLRALRRFDGAARQPEFLLVGPPKGETLAIAALLPGTGSERAVALELADQARIAEQLRAFAIELRPFTAPGAIAEGANGHIVLAGYDGNAIGSLAWTGRRIAAEGTRQVLPALIGAVFLSTFVLLGLRRHWQAAKARFEHDIEAVEHMAGTDPLTGLPNRRALFRHLAKVAPATAPFAPITVMMLDLDGFKWINDQFGHETGDRVIQQAASVFRAELGTEAFVARLGGDEFVVIIPGTLGSRALMRLYESLTEAMRRGIAVARSGVGIGLSIGAVTSIDNPGDGEDLLKKADLAVYATKAGGRGSATLYNPAMKSGKNYRRQLERELRAALLTRDIVVHHQPIVEALSGRVVGYETLVRWRHPYRGLLSPAEFIPHVEDSDLIVGIGAAVLEQALEELGPLDNCRISVNATGRQLLSPGFADHVREALARHGVAPERLCIELTETSFVLEADRLAEVMRNLRASGVKFAIDDFGVGYSSLSYLLRFRFDILKIDRDFIIALDDKPESPMIVTSIVSLARSLGMQVVGEGIETLAQHRFLASAGCTMLQGFLFGAPRPVGELGLAPATKSPNLVIRTEAA